MLKSINELNDKNNSKVTYDFSTLLSNIDDINKEINQKIQEYEDKSLDSKKYIDESLPLRSQSLSLTRTIIKKPRK